MGWVTFNVRGGGRVRFNTDKISAVSESVDNSNTTLIEVMSGKDFWVVESFESVNQQINAHHSPEQR